MKSGASFCYLNDDRGITIHIATPDDIDLTTLTANYIEFTRMLGYHSGSWEKIIKDINSNNGLSETYTIFDWASDKLI